jgi:hypothetical protein
MQLLDIGGQAGYIYLVYFNLRYSHDTLLSKPGQYLSGRAFPNGKEEIRTGIDNIQIMHTKELNSNFFVST